MVSDTNDADSRDEKCLNLHFSEGGPVELEVWNLDADESDHVLTEYPDKEPTSIDITAELERAGYRLEKIDDDNGDE